MPAAQPSEARIRNAIKAAKAEGLPIGVIEITKDGALRILASAEVEPVSSTESAEGAWDEATGTVS